MELLTLNYFFDKAPLERSDEVQNAFLCFTENNDANTESLTY